ncbi:MULTISPECIES: Uma2 family endonuclease [unclassified Coleofasciculus]|uniref:Uma2 family endonuclease n=1 Tax=unclassified Coleofasciculus TaxID=2692782 RepID=UPI00187E33A1|nr:MULTISPECIES: Uma2 family endonuclease [unclassified Coleofasciculus]MBE9125210.1 Uma2 family endonuclease [Coleofasciculus sp. LEGE 07081]MBE9152264.1 Uma2 family endonuclease [Coleofasciculus sp. LEGE 07092]
MTTVTTQVENSPLVLHLHPVINLTDEQFFEFCQINRDLRIERTATGELLIMPPTGSETGNRNAKLIVQLGVWAERDGTGIYFDSSTGFKLPNGAERSPDAAWVKLERWNALTPEQQKKFAPIGPEFVVELRSASDNLEPLKTKMQEYIDNGTLLGWLIDRKNRQVYIYRPGVDVECLENPATVSCESVLPGFVMDLSKIW